MYRHVIFLCFTIMLKNKLKFFLQYADNMAKDMRNADRVIANGCESLTRRKYKRLQLPPRFARG